MKSFLCGFVTATLILPLTVAVFFRLGGADVDIDSAPPAWERGLLTIAVRESISKRAAYLPVSPATNEGALIKGGKLYMNGCAGCHGELSKPSREDHANYPRVPQFPDKGTQYSPPQVYWVVKHGIRMTAMSAYGRFYSEEDLWFIAAFVYQIRNLPPSVQTKILAKTAIAAP